VGFSDPHNIVTGTLPDILLRAPLAGYIVDIRGILGTLWYSNSYYSSVCGFLNAATIESGQSPDIVLSDADMVFPMWLVVHERE